MRHVLHTDPIAVSPPGPQTVHTPPFELRAGTRIVIEAGGEIGSGVLFTGSTPPAGWNELAAGDGDRDWPYRGRQDAFRYSLIGTFAGDGIPTDWFYIGPGRTIVGNGAVSGSVRLRLAVNRPHVDRPAVGPNPGDGQWNVVVDVYQPEPAAVERRPTTQDAWQWCNKCQGLSYAGSRDQGRCPAGGEHDHLGSGNYVLTADGPGQGDWRWCNRCQGLFFHGSDSFGRCPAGGTHAPDALRVSGNYTLVSDGPGQRGWRWCNRCQGLFFHGSGSRGRCPEGGEHNIAGSGDYVLSTQAACQHVAATFSGQVTMRTSHPDAEGPYQQAFATPMVFATDCRSVRVTGFPPLALTFDTRAGRNTTTVSLRGGGAGVFERRRQGSRPMEIPITLHFQHSLPAGNSDLSITLTSGSAASPLDGGLTGSPIDGAGALTLVGAGRFRDGFLGDRDCTLQLVGSVTPIP